MKKVLKIILKLLRAVSALVLSVLVAFFIIAFFEGWLFPNKIPRSFDCDYRRTHHFDRSFRDIFTFSCYELDSPQVDTEQFAPVTKESRLSIIRCLNAFEGLVNSHKACDGNNCEPDGSNCEVAKNYNYNRSTLDSSDWFWLENKRYTEDRYLGDFELYIFDTATNMLYHFHLTS